jgi:hypothetical protein
MGNAHSTFQHLLGSTGPGLSSSRVSVSAASPAAVRAGARQGLASALCSRLRLWADLRQQAYETTAYATYNDVTFAPHAD